MRWSPRPSPLRVRLYLVDACVHGTVQYIMRPLLNYRRPRALRYADSNSRAVVQGDETRRLTLPLKAKGYRPMFFDDPNIDRLLDIILRQSSEISVLYERLDTLEQLLVSSGTIAADSVENFRVDDETFDRREAWRLEYLRRVFRIVQNERESLVQGDTEEAYHELYAAVSRG